jgi:hypothetical protein
LASMLEKSVGVAGV